MRPRRARRRPVDHWWSNRCRRGGTGSRYARSSLLDRRRLLRESKGGGVNAAATGGPLVGDGRLGCARAAGTRAFRVVAGRARLASWGLDTLVPRYSTGGGQGCWSRYARSSLLDRREWVRLVRSRLARSAGEVAVSYAPSHLLDTREAGGRLLVWIRRCSLLGPGEWVSGRGSARWDGGLDTLVPRYSTGCDARARYGRLFLLKPRGPNRQ